MPGPAPRESAFTAAQRRPEQTRPPDSLIASLANRQHGVISRGQLVELGLSESAINRRIRAGRLHLLHLGVYAVGHLAIPREGRWLAAVIRGGAGAVLSHRTAAELWGIQRGGAHTHIEITVPRKVRSHGTIHRHCSLHALDEVTRRRGIAVTSLPRTVLDIAAVLSVEGLEAAIREAEYLHRFRLESLEHLLERHPGRRGVTTINVCLHRLGRGPHGRTRSRLEVRFAALLAHTDLPKPTLNALLDIDGFKIEADCLWRDQRLIVELDGGEAHGTRVAFETDRERDRRVQAAGWRVIRVTWRQMDDPGALLNDLRRLLDDETVLSVA